MPKRSRFVSSFRSFGPAKKRTRRFGRFKRRALAPRRTGGFFSVRNRTIGAEKKTLDNLFTSANACDNTTDDAWVLNTCATGSDFTNRIGRRIKMKTILARFSCRYAGTVTTVTPQTWRIICAIDKQWNATATAVSNNVPQADFPITNILTNNLPVAPMNLNNRDRFKIVFDKMVTIDPFNQVKNLSIYKRIPYDVTYGGTTNDGGSIQTGAVVLWVFSNAAAGSAGVYNMHTRIRFIDA